MLSLHVSACLQQQFLPRMALSFFFRALANQLLSDSPEQTGGVQVPFVLIFAFAAGAISAHHWPPFQYKHFSYFFPPCSGQPALFRFTGADRGGSGSFSAHFCLLWRVRFCMLLHACRSNFCPSWASLSIQTLLNYNISKNALP